MTEPRWLADEMLGKLARYLRFVGCDTVYVRGRSDAEVAEQVRVERRTLLTRDRARARAVAPAVWIRATDIEGQWKELRAARPDLPDRVAFARCTLCNGLLDARPPGPFGPWPPGVPDRVRAAGTIVYRCAHCGHVYWPGSHTDRVAQRLAAWSTGDRA